MPTPNDIAACEAHGWDGDRRDPDDPRTDDYPLMGKDLQRGQWYEDEFGCLVLGIERLKTDQGTLVAIDITECPGLAIYTCDGPFRETKRRPWRKR